VTTLARLRYEGKGNSRCADRQLGIKAMGSQVEMALPSQPLSSGGCTGGTRERKSCGGGEDDRGLKEGVPTTSGFVVSVKEKTRKGGSEKEKTCGQAYDSQRKESKGSKKLSTLETLTTTKDEREPEKGGAEQGTWREGERGEKAGDASVAGGQKKEEVDSGVFTEPR